MILLLLLPACRPQPRPESGSAIQALSQKPSVAGFARANAPRALRFPADDGPHPEFQTEWWYLTGNLDSGGRHFGYQLTFFRRGLKPGADPDVSDWATQQIWFAHFTLTDVKGQAFYPFERWGRESIGLAGAQAEPFKVWIDHWTLSGDPQQGLTLRAAEGPVALELTLRALKPEVLQGDQGLSQKSAEIGNASYYYSRPRMASTGIVRIQEQSWPVTGLSWMDREWSTSALSPQQSGWDWFSLQFEDGRELMLYQLRLRSGGLDPYSGGSLIAADGSSRKLTAKDFRITPLAHWTSPATGVRYPSRWHVQVASAGLELQIEPWLADQELPLSFRYWEGAVKVTGSARGQGYVELTGYGDESERVN